MHLTKEEKLAIVYSCWSLAHNNGFLSRAEQITLDIIAKQIGFNKEYSEELQTFGIKRAISVMKGFNQAKKDLVTNHWCLIIHYTGKTDMKTLASLSQKADKGEDIGIDTEHLAGLISLLFDLNHS